MRAWLGIALVLVMGSSIAGAQRVRRGDAQAYAPELLGHALRDLGPLQRCFAAANVDPQQALLRMRSVAVIVGSDGHVQRVSVSPRNAIPAPVRSCVVPIVQAWPLTPPRPSGALSLTFSRSMFVAATGAR